MEAHALLDLARTLSFI